MLGVGTLIDAQLSKLSSAYPGVCYEPASRTVTMPYRLNAEYDGCQIVEDYSLRIVLNEGYPDVLPSVYEESGKICGEFEHWYGDESLCVGVPGELLMECLDGMDIVDFIEGPVSSCLYSAAFLERYGRYPFGERSHGIDGILEYYRELFKVESFQSALDLMRTVAAGGNRGCDKCPCGSGRQTWNCHGGILDRLKSDHCRRAIAIDLGSVESVLETGSKRRLVSQLIRSRSQSMWRVGHEHRR